MATEAEVQKGWFEKYQQFIVGIASVVVLGAGGGFGIYNSLDARLDNVESEVHSNAQKLDNIESEIEYLRRVTEEERADIAGLEAKVEDIHLYVIRSNDD